MAAFQVDVQPLGDRTRHRHRRAVAILAVLAAVATAVAVLLGTGTLRLDGTAVAHRDRIAYVDEGGNLSVIGADGSGPRAYPVPGSSFGFPAWSPDGTRVAVIGSDATGGGIDVFDDTAGGAASAPPPLAVYPHSSSVPIYLYWSPDGSRIAFLTNEPDGLALRVAGSDGSGTPVVVQRGQPMYFDWVDDASLLVHRGGAAPDAFLGEVQVGASTAPDSLGSPGEFQAPGIAAGGAARAFVIAAGADQARVVVEPSQTSARLEAPVAGASAIGWSPAGDQLAYTAPARSNGLPFGALDLMDVRTGDTRTLLDGTVVAYFWAPDGRTIAAIRIVAADAPTAAVAPVADTPALGLAFVDVATGTIRNERQVRLSGYFAAQFLPFFDQYALSHRVWSAASDAVVLPLVDDAGRAHVTLVPADGSAARVLADGVAASWSP